MCKKKKKSVILNITVVKFQITKKLAGHGRGTVLWVTSISNEVGQILTSVLTVQEGPGLDRMVSGVMERYRQAAVPPPVLLYVNCGCCVSEGASKLQIRFAESPDIHIQLDIWHFMRRLAVGCTTDAHPLYPTFMGCLSAYIFEWDAGDLTLLQQAKRQQFRQEGVPALTDLLVDMRITKKELSQYCCKEDERRGGHHQPHRAVAAEAGRAKQERPHGGATAPCLVPTLNPSPLLCLLPPPWLLCPPSLLHPPWVLPPSLLPPCRSQVSTQLLLTSPWYANT